MSLSTVLGLQYSDGVIEFRDRTNLEILARDDYLTQVSSLSQVGFEFPDVGLGMYFWSSLMDSGRRLRKRI